MTAHDSADHVTLGARSGHNIAGTKVRVDK